MIGKKMALVLSDKIACTGEVGLPETEKEYAKEDR